MLSERQVLANLKREGQTALEYVDWLDNKRDRSFLPEDHPLKFEEITPYLPELWHKLDAFLEVFVRKYPNPDKQLCEDWKFKAKTILLRAKLSVWVITTKAQLTREQYEGLLEQFDFHADQLQVMALRAEDLAVIGAVFLGWQQAHSYRLEIQPPEPNGEDGSMANFEAQNSKQLTMLQEMIEDLPRLVRI